LSGNRRLNALLPSVAKELHSLLAPRYGARAPPKADLNAAGAEIWIARQVQERRLRVLLVLDDVWEKEVVEAFHRTGMRLLVTTRKTEVASAGNVNPVIVGCVDKDTARCMIARAAGIHPEQLPPEASRVLSECANLPLALAMAGALCRGGRWAETADHWRHGQHKLEKRDTFDRIQVVMDDNATERHSSLHSMIELSIARLPRDVRLAYFSLALAPKRLPLKEDLLLALFGANGPPELVESGRGWRDMLVESSLLTIAHDGSCMAHDLQLDYLKQSRDARANFRQVADRLSVFLIRESTLDDLAGEDMYSGTPMRFALMALWREVEYVIPDAVGSSYLLNPFLQNAIEGDTVSKMITRSKRIDAAAKMLTIMDHLGPAMQLYQRVLCLEEAAYGKEHTEVAGTMCNIGSLLAKQDQLSAACELYSRALTIQEAVHGHEHLEITSALLNFGDVLHMQDKLSEALALYERGLKILTAAYGPEHSSVGTALCNIASVYCKQARNMEALDIYEQVQAAKEVSHGPDHPEVINALNGQAIILQRIGSPDKALELYERILVIEEAFYGAEHTETAGSLANMGIVLRVQGKLPEAYLVLERALNIQEKLLGSDHKAVAVTLTSMANVKTLQRQFDEAVALYERSLAIKEAVDGPDHTSVATTLSSLGTLRAKQGKFREAIQLLERALPAFENIAVDHPSAVHIRASIRNLTEYIGE
jgi:tetratricopeptide (TPR) repeat protein